MEDSGGKFTSTSNILFSIIELPRTAVLEVLKRAAVIKEGSVGDALFRKMRQEVHEKFPGAAKEMELSFLGVTDACK